VPLLDCKDDGVVCTAILHAAVPNMTPVQIFGRRSSHFTRVTRIFAEELGVAYEIVPIYDLKERDPDLLANNPALKLPTLRIGGDSIFGTENICRTLAEHAGSPAGIVWPEQLRSPVQRNAQELVWHCMAAQVQIVVGTLVGKLPIDNVYFDKALAGFAGALGWLDRHAEAVVASLPPSRRLSLFETTLFCLIEHLRFRQTLAVEGYAALARFAATFATRPAAERTPYQLEVRPN
jgi:glutathione S-transferase